MYAFNPQRSLPFSLYGVLES